MMKLKFKNRVEINTFYNYLLKAFEKLPYIENQFYGALIDSIFDDILKQLINKINNLPKSIQLNLKMQEAIVIFTVWMDSKFDLKLLTPYDLNTIRQKMNSIDQYLKNNIQQREETVDQSVDKNVGKPLENVFNGSKNVLESVDNGKKTHFLRTWPVYFNQTWDEVKLFEIRKNDRNFQIGDFLVLEEYDSEFDLYSGRKIKTVISSLVSNLPGIGIDYCILGIQIIEKLD